MGKNYWLMKSEPDVWSIDQQQKAGIKGATWDGVRNYQAANNLKKMKKGDLCFFYHSNIGKEIVGIIEIIKTAFLDKTDKENRFVAVQVKFKEKLRKPVTLEIPMFLFFQQQRRGADPPPVGRNARAGNA